MEQDRAESRLLHSGPREPPEPAKCQPHLSVPHKGSSKGGPEGLFPLQALGGEKWREAGNLVDDPLLKPTGLALGLDALSECGASWSSE